MRWSICCMSRTAARSGSQQRTSARLDGPAANDHRAVGMYLHSLIGQRHVTGGSSIYASVFVTLHASIKPPCMWGAA
jgi:hypothetical protein